MLKKDMFFGLVRAGRALREAKHQQERKGIVMIYNLARERKLYAAYKKAARIALELKRPKYLPLSWKMAAHLETYAAALKELRRGIWR
jgi:hypothetical protein